MMMTVMMMVLMPMNDWLPIIIARVIVFVAVPLTVMMFTVLMMALWPR